MNALEALIKAGVITVIPVGYESEHAKEREGEGE
jgi:hypothetical protein